MYGCKKAHEMGKIMNNHRNESERLPSLSLVNPCANVHDFRRYVLDLTTKDARDSSGGEKRSLHRRKYVR